MADWLKEDLGGRFEFDDDGWLIIPDNILKTLSPWMLRCKRFRRSGLFYSEDENGKSRMCNDGDERCKDCGAGEEDDINNPYMVRWAKLRGQVMERQTTIFGGIINE